MPFDLRLTNGDVVVDPFDLQLNDPGAEAVAQRIAITLKTFRGEYFLDTSFGAPWYQNILVKGVGIRLIDSILRRLIINVPGVIEMIEYSSSRDTGARSLRVEFKVRVADGVVDAVLTPEELTFRVTEDGNFRVTQSGQFRIV